jgi:hypothetical protein
MGLLTTAKRLDDVVLGTSDSTRGFVMNAMYGMHPVLAPVYAVLAPVLVVVAFVLLSTDRPMGALGAGGLAVLFAAKGYVSRRLPRVPRS